MNIKPVPPLQNGDRLTQAEFHRRYEQYPENIKAELIGGIVYMASPLRLPHGEHHLELSGVFWVYKGATPGVRATDNTTAILGDQSEPQPDLTLRLLPEYGGQSISSPEQYMVGGPELVSEIAHSSVAIDLYKKREDYQRAGVQEYLVVCLEEQEIQWFDFASGGVIEANRQGIHRSRVFPGLWLDGAALFALDSIRLMAVIQEGIASREHAAFVKRLQKLCKKT